MSIYNARDDVMNIPSRLSGTVYQKWAENTWRIVPKIKEFPFATLPDLVLYESCQRFLATLLTEAIASVDKIL